MKTRISQLMDGELERHEAAGPLDALRTEGEVRDSWRAYHLIGDAMRDTRMLSAGFAARVVARLAEEPSVMAPARVAPAPQRRRWQLLSAAASLAAIAMVTSAWYALQEGAVPGPQVAQVEPAAAQVPPPDTADDYLYAHQGYSPRNSLQGIAPYVRTVSGEARARK
jgi:sigma-E factor negative regulatory protein RseA